MLRVVGVVLAIFLFLILFLPVWCIIRIIGFFNRRAMAVASQAIIRGVFTLVLWIAGAKKTVLGKENVPKDQAVMFAANHRSYGDIPLTYVTCPVTVGFVAKKEINRVPIFNWWMRNMNCLFLDRDDPRQGLKTILSAIDNVKAGYSMMIMPEGTRNHGEEMLPFKGGSFKIAEKTGCPVVPVAISNTDELYENHRPAVRKAKVVIHYGEPIYTAGMSREELKALPELVRDRIGEMLAEDKQYI